MNEDRFAKCPTCTSLCKLYPVREQIAPTVWGEVVKYASLIPRLLQSYEWMLKDIKWRRDQQDNPGKYSPELTEAIEIYDILKNEQDSG